MIQTLILSLLLNISWSFEKTHDTAYLIIGKETQLNVEVGDTIGAFYENEGQLVCGGMTTYKETATILFMYCDDIFTEEKDGFDKGDEVVFLLKNGPENELLDVGVKVNYKVQKVYRAKSLNK